MSDTAYERLVALAQDIYTRDSALAERIAAIAEEIEANYVLADAEGDIPTNAQGVALARFLRPAFRADEPRDRQYASISRGGAGLPDHYIHVRLSDGYEGGIDRDGRTST